MRRAGVLAFLMLIFGGAACSHEKVNLPKDIVDHNEDRFSLSFYKGGHIYKEEIFEKGSEGYLKVNDWLRKNSSGWSKSYSDYAPELVARGSLFSIKKNGMAYIIVYEIKSGSYMQLEKTTNDSFL
jgi:hypothetical protein